ncbi:MAG: MoxR family ATPase [Victivallaceae bacterium]|nr:MoxR family ATPase [Victivallaceae bacterium]
MENDPLRDLEQLQTAFSAVKTELSKVIVGQEQVIWRILIALLSGGHCLLLGVPGLAKTLLVHSLGEVLNLEFRRIQFTPDLMPSDITGTDILNEEPGSGHRELRFVKGPVFANLLLADEINRTPPKTQAALLEAMQEKHVTNAGVKYSLPQPFFVMATQNPIEQEGTYPLPEAQLDRFMFLVKLDYPARHEEIDILRQTTANREVVLEKILDGGRLIYFQQVVRSIPVSDHVTAYCADLVRFSRPENPEAPDFVKRNLNFGAGPRAGQYLMLAAKARAALNGRFNICCEDVRCCAYEIMRHRMACNFHAVGENLTPDSIIKLLLDHVPEPAA